jgi:hypothetical protein
MTREDVERGLREQLSAVRARSSYGWKQVPLLPSVVNATAASLLPWILEMIEAARAEERIDCGELP